VNRAVPDADRLAAWRDFLVAHTRVMRALERDLKRDFGLTAAQYDVLLKLAGVPGCRMRMSELAGALLYSSGGPRSCSTRWSPPAWPAASRTRPTAARSMPPSRTPAANGWAPPTATT
jgi:hypothetical protein